jgi:hypothetical protein
MMKNILFVLFAIPFVSFGQQVDCIDSTAINPDCFCFDVYDPVVGCNGINYSNECYAACDGVQYWTPLIQVGGSVCDSIEVNVLLVTNENISFEYVTFFSQNQNFGYAGFVLIDEMGDTVAVENVETAANVYGISGGMYENRLLESYNGGYELPLQAELHLVEGFFAGNPETVCSIPLYIAQGPSENDTVELSGQWYSSQENEYIEFLSDSINIYSYIDELECYEFYSISYVANDSTLFISDQGDVSALAYTQTELQLSLFVEDELVVLDLQAFDPLTLDICVNQSFDCTPTGCISLASYEGEFYDLDECEMECESNPLESWNCVDGNCEQLNDTSGTYTSYQSCLDMCSLSNLTDYKISKNIIKVTDLLGREVNTNYNQIVIFYYEDGSVEKKYLYKK